MLKKILEGFYFGIGFILIIGILFGIVYAVGFHTADEILGGTFTGDYNFQGNVTINNVDMTPETTRNITFDNSMTAAQIQAEINKVGKYIPVGNIITFQFTDGTYNLDQSLSFTGFYGGGVIYIFGNRTQANAGTLHSDQQVFLDFSSQDINGLTIQKNEILVYVYDLHIKVKTDVGNYRSIDSQFNSLQNIYDFNYLEGTDPTYGYGVYSRSENTIVINNYVSNLRGGLRCDYGKMLSNNNDDIGTMPAQGLWASHGGTISKYDAVQPSGSSNNEYVVRGGVIR